MGHSQLCSTAALTPTSHSQRQPALTGRTHWAPSHQRLGQVSAGQFPIPLRMSRSRGLTRPCPRTPSPLAATPTGGHVLQPGLGAPSWGVHTVSLTAVSVAGRSICFSSVSGEGPGHGAPTHAGPTSTRAGSGSPPAGARGLGVGGRTFLRKSPSYLPRAGLCALCSVSFLAVALRALRGETTVIYHVICLVCFLNQGEH